MDRFFYNYHNHDFNGRPEFYGNRYGCFIMDRVKHPRFNIDFNRYPYADHIRGFADVYFNFQQDIYRNINRHSDADVYGYHGSDADFYGLKNTGEYINLYMDRNKDKHSDFDIYHDNTCAYRNIDNNGNIHIHAVCFGNTCGGIVLSCAIQSTDAGS